MTEDAVFIGIVALAALCTWLTVKYVVRPIAEMLTDIQMAMLDDLFPPL